jgi:hypothetical protein
VRGLRGLELLPQPRHLLVPLLHQPPQLPHFVLPASESGREPVGGRLDPNAAAAPGRVIRVSRESVRGWGEGLPEPVDCGPRKRLPPTASLPGVAEHRLRAEGRQLPPLAAFSAGSRDSYTHNTADGFLAAFSAGCRGSASCNPSRSWRCCNSEELVP